MCATNDPGVDRSVTVPQSRRATSLAAEIAPAAHDVLGVGFLQVTPAWWQEWRSNAQRHHRTPPNREKHGAHSANVDAMRRTGRYHRQNPV